MVADGRSGSRKLPSDLVFSNIGDVDAGVPALSAVGGSEGGNARVAFEGNDDGSVGLYQRLSA